MTPKMKFLRHLGNTITDQEKGNPRLFLTSTMELENRDFRAIIYFDLKRGLTYRDSHKNLCEAFGSIDPGISTVSKWFRELRFGRSRFNDDNRCDCGHPRECRPCQRIHLRRPTNNLQSSSRHTWNWHVCLA